MFKSIYRSSSKLLDSLERTIICTRNFQRYNFTNFQTLLTSQTIGKGLNNPNTLTTESTYSTFLIQFTKKSHNMASGGSQTEDAKTSFKYTNRLAQEKSPYLLQHAHNPVDWYPWCDEAIEKARRENKLIFLSVGYSTCHWCHVMEHESFENEEVAELMNKYFVNIKVDREERPDIDRLYMNFVLMIHGSGGWPMSIWLTPELNPVTAGTYFPPKDRWGSPGFSTVLKSLAQKWQKNNDKVRTTGKNMIKVLQEATAPRVPKQHDIEDNSIQQRLQETNYVMKERFDYEYGGFDSSPKFPQVSLLNLVLHMYAVTKEKETLEMVLHTLDCIGKGGIHDHIFGGFARYAVDSKWRVPHFEKMLYDQAQLMAINANVYKLTGNRNFLDCADGIFRYITTDLQHPLGGFYAGEDADSLPNEGAPKKIEGAFYIWDYKEIEEILISNEEALQQFTHEIGDVKKLFDIYCYHYDIKQNGNVTAICDPHGHFTKKNILTVCGSLKETSAHFNIEKSKLKELLSVINRILYKVRCRRPRPQLDTKIICSWNGLMLSGLSKLASCDCDPNQKVLYMEAAKKLKQFMYEHFYDKETGKLKRSQYGLGTNDSTILENPKTKEIAGFADDYAFLIQGLLDYYEASCDKESLDWAKKLQDTQNALFWDNANYGYFYSEDNSIDVSLRLKDDHDGAEPSANSISARNLQILAYYYDEADYTRKVKQLFQCFGQCHSLGLILPGILSATLLHEYEFDVVAIVNSTTGVNERFLSLCRKYFIPGLILQIQNADTPYGSGNKNKMMINDSPTVYICHKHVCQLPITDEKVLEEKLHENFYYNELSALQNEAKNNPQN